MNLTWMMLLEPEILLPLASAAGSLWAWLRTKDRRASTVGKIIGKVYTFVEGSGLRTPGEKEAQAIQAFREALRAQGLGEPKPKELARARSEWKLMSGAEKAPEKTRLYWGFL